LKIPGEKEVSICTRKGAKEKHPQIAPVRRCWGGEIAKGKKHMIFPTQGRFGGRGRTEK